jgi:hypothetical protein
LWLATYGNATDGYTSDLFGKIAADAHIYNIVVLNNSWGIITTQTNMLHSRYFLDIMSHANKNLMSGHQ